MESDDRCPRCKETRQQGPRRDGKKGKCDVCLGIEAVKAKTLREGRAAKNWCRCKAPLPPGEKLCLECAMRHKKKHKNPAIQQLLNEVNDYANYRAGDLVTVLVRPRLLARSDVQAELDMTPDDVRRDLLRRRKR